MIGRRYSEGKQVCLAQKLQINKVVHKAKQKKKKLKKKEKTHYWAEKGLN